MGALKRKMSWIIVLMVIIGLFASHIWRQHQPKPVELTPATLEQLIVENQEVLAKLEKMRDQIKAQEGRK